MKKGRFFCFLAAVAIPLAIGSLSGFLVGSANGYANLVKPPLSPPGYVFPIAWTILYILMGIASYLALRSTSGKCSSRALYFYGAQLIVNFLWSFLFFGLDLQFFSFLWILLLIVLVLFTFYEFYKCSKPAAYLLIPYLIWLVFAAYLNFAIWFLNR